MFRGPVLPLLLVMLAVFTIVGFRYNQYVQERNYLLNVNTGCNTESESCFAADCSVASDPSCDPTPYEKVVISAHDAPSCLEEHSCESFSCGNIASCSISYCSKDTITEGERCLDIVTQKAVASSTPK